MADVKIKEIKEQYRLLFENINDAIFLTHPDGHIYSANPAACKIFQRSEEEICKVGRAGIVDINDKRLKFALEERKKTGKFEGELNQVRKDGTIFPAIVTTFSFKDSNGKESSFVIVKDINEQKTTEEKLERFFNLVPDMVCIASTDGFFKKINPVWETVLGFSQEEILATPFMELIHPDDRKATINEINLQIEGSKTMYFQNRYRCKDGSYKWLEWMATPAIDKNLFAAARDISERKKHEMVLKESEAKCRSFFENSLIGISATDSSGKLIHTNKAYAKMYGYESPEKMMAEVTDIENQLFINHKDRKEVLKNLHDKGFVEPKEYEVKRKDGSHLIVLVSANEVRDNEGNFLYNQASHIDLTEQQLVKNELKQSKELLEKLNKRLTEIREDERAVIAREIHDIFGQSLTALKLDLSWLLENSINETKAKEKIENMIELISTTINDVQRISSELRPGMLDDIGLASTIEWYCDEFSKRSGINLELDIENVQTESNNKNLSIYRILQESLTNVIRHSKAKNIWIKLRKVNDNIILKVLDDGIGIPVNKINSKLSLGLMGMYERVRQSDGKIKISSPRNKGTYIKILIPISN